MHGYLGAFYNHIDHVRFVLYYTSDGGYNWDQTVIRIAHIIEGFSFPENDNGWLVGYHSTICHIFKDSVSVGVEENYKNKTIQDYKVSVYPNPCRQILNIDYSLEHSEIVKLQVFNSAGKLEYHSQIQQKDGSQKITLDVSKLTPGMYLYSLETQKCRKMGKFIISGDR